MHHLARHRPLPPRLRANALLLPRVDPTRHNQSPLLLQRLTVSIDPTTQAIANLLNAMTDLPVIAHTSIQLHDRDGSIIRALRIWADANNHSIRRVSLKNPNDRLVWDCFEVVGSWGTVDVHDHRSEREMVVQDSTGQDSYADCDAVWSVGQHAADGAL